jgi:hypothetical protein
MINETIITFYTVTISGTKHSSCQYYSGYFNEVLFRTKDLQLAQ